MSRQRTHFRTWGEELDHRERVHKKCEKVQGLQALIEDWEKNEVDTDEYRDYLRRLKERHRQARNQLFAMKP